MPRTLDALSTSRYGPTCVLNRHSLGARRSYAVTRNPLRRPATPRRRSPTARRAPPRATRAPAGASRCRGSSRVGGESLEQDLRRWHGAAGVLRRRAAAILSIWLAARRRRYWSFGSAWVRHVCDSADVNARAPGRPCASALWRTSIRASTSQESPSRRTARRHVMTSVGSRPAAHFGGRPSTRSYVVSIGGIAAAGCLLGARARPRSRDRHASSG